MERPTRKGWLMTYDAYFEAVSEGDAAAAVAVLRDEMDRGAPPQRLVRDFVVRGQAEAGGLWLDGLWGVAEEQAATAVAEQVLAVLTHLGPRPRATERPRILVACPEGEWHTFPARLAATLAGALSGSVTGVADLDVVTLGGSLPATELRRHLRATRPTALALSVTMPTNLISAGRSIRAAHAEGVPVVVGGAAWGHGQHRARRLGADLWLEDPADLRSVLGQLEVTPSGSVAPLPVEAVLLDRATPALIKPVFERFALASGWVRPMTRPQREQVQANFRLVARFTAAAVACDDPTVVRGVIHWLLGLAEARGLPARAVIDGCSYLADGLVQVAPVGAAILRREAEWALAGELVTDALAEDQVAVPSA